MSLPEELLDGENRNKEKFLKLAFGLGVICFLCSILMYLYYLKNKDSMEIIEISDDIINNDKYILIDISGAIENPGIYELKDNERVNDLLIKAGGFDEKVNKEWVAKNLNLASGLNDGQKKYIPFENEEVNSNSESSTININLASWEELMKLNGVGEKTAKIIVEYRNENGSFDSVGDLLEVPGIGEKTVEGWEGEVSF